MNNLFWSLAWSLIAWWDPYWSSVVLWLHLDWTNGSTTFTDVKGHTITGAGNSQLSTAQKEFGTASLLLDWNWDYVAAADSNDWYFWTWAFTWEMFVRFSSDKYMTLIGMQTAAWDEWLEFSYSNTWHFLQFYSWELPWADYVIRFVSQWSFTPTLNTWYHIAVVRVDNWNAATSWRMFINGTAYALTLLHWAWNAWIKNYNCEFTVWWYQATPTSSVDWYIDDVRITKWIARYTSNFTVPTSAFPDYPITATPWWGTWNPADKDAAVTLSNGNLTATANWNKGVRWTTSIDWTGRHVYEVHLDTYTTGTDMFFGIATLSASLSTFLGMDVYWWWYDVRDWSKLNNGVNPAYWASIAAWDVVGIVLENWTLTFYKNWVSQWMAYTWLTGTFFPAIQMWGNFISTANFGATPFTYTY